VILLDARRLKALGLDGTDPAYEQWLRANENQERSRSNRYHAQGRQPAEIRFTRFCWSCFALHDLIPDKGLLNVWPTSVTKNAAQHIVCGADRIIALGGPLLALDLGAVHDPA
jgi:hypothetical protein